MFKKIFVKILRHFFSLSPSKNFLNNALVEAIPSPVFWLDHKKVYQGCNQLFADLMGFERPSAIIGLDDNHLPSLNADLSERDSIFNIILSGEVPAKVIYDCIIGEHDHTIWAQKRFTPLKNRKGKIIGVLGVVVDITEKVKRRKEMEAHVERQHILGRFLDELNMTFMNGLNYQELIEKFGGILHSETEAKIVIFIKANARTPQGFVRFCTDNSLDIHKLFESRSLLLKEAKKSGYLNSRSLKSMNDAEDPINSIYCYRMELHDILKYDEMIVLINPQKEKLETAAPFFALASHIIQSYYMRKFLMAQSAEGAKT